MERLLEKIKAHPRYKGQIVHVEYLPPREPRYGELPKALHPFIEGALRQRNIERLYTHQAEAVEAIRQGRNVVVVTPTASGKSMCYNLPVLDSILRRPGNTALYLFPTKSLGRDQLDALLEFELPLRAGVYDETPPTAKRQPCGTAPVSSSPTRTCCTAASCPTT